MFLINLGVAVGLLGLVIGAAACTYTLQALGIVIASGFLFLTCTVGVYGTTAIQTFEKAMGVPNGTKPGSRGQSE